MTDTAVLAAKLDIVWNRLSPEEKKAADSLLADHCNDPLVRLFDPSFKAASWTYEHSKIDSPLPGKLHTKQLEATLAMATHKHSFLFWGNQVGKTTWGAIMTVLVALGRHPHLKKWDPPVVAWASALSWELWEKILLPELLTWIPPSRLLSAPPAMRKSTNRDILVRADNGRISRITGKAAEQGADKYQSARVHLVWTDEEHPEAVWDEMQPRLLRHGGITINTVTPIKGLTWLYSRIYEPWKKGQRPDTFVSHAGLVDNPSVTAEEIRLLTAELSNNPAMLAARLHGKFVRPTGLVLPMIPAVVMGASRKAELEAARALVRRGSVTAAIDFGLHRFAFILAAADSQGKLTLLAEYFSQGESLDLRAEEIDRILSLYEVKAHQLRFVGDCANPTDILELNLAFQRAESDFRVAGVMMEHKIIKAGISRVLGLVAAGELVRSSRLGEAQHWQEGRTASKPGRPIIGSRLVWELNNWMWPKTTDRRPDQRDVPDDSTADGADMMAALRYLVMAWWYGKGAPDPATRDEDQYRHENTTHSPTRTPRSRESSGGTPQTGRTARSSAAIHGGTMDCVTLYHGTASLTSTVNPTTTTTRSEGMARKKKRIPGAAALAKKSPAVEGSSVAVVGGVVGGGRIVRRHELSSYMELRLQAFVAEELQPTLEGMIAEVVQPVVAQLVRQYLVAQGIIQEERKPGQLVGLDGEVITTTPPAGIFGGITEPMDKLELVTP